MDSFVFRFLWVWCVVVGSGLTGFRCLMLFGSLVVSDGFWVSGGFCCMIPIVCFLGVSFWWLVCYVSCWWVWCLGLCW